MKISLIGPAYPLRGGIANFNESLCRTLIRGGDECHIFSYYLQYPKLLFPGKTQAAENDPSPNLPVSATLSSINPWSWKRTAHMIRTEKPDLIIVRYWLPFMAPSLAMTLRWARNKSFKPPVIAITDNVVPHEKRPGDVNLTKLFLKQCDGFVVMSEQVQRDLEAFHVTQPISLLHHPVYTLFGSAPDRNACCKQLNIDPEGRYLLFFGFIRKYKGLDLLLQAMSDERVRKLNVKLIVAGEFYDDKKEYQQLIYSLGIGDRVILHDHYIPKEAVRYYFGACDIVTQPYRDATQSGVTQIAYHFEKPMIVTNVGGLPEMVPHNVAGYVTEVEPTAIADAVIDFYTNNKAETLTAGVKQEAKRFSWEAFAEGVKALSKKLK